MRDIDAQIFTAVKQSVISEYDKAFVTGEYTTKPKGFPCVTCLEISNLPDYRSLDLEHKENLTRVEYQIEIFTHGTGKKAQGRKIFALVDDVMSGMGFIRSFAQTIPNFADETVWRYILRYYKKIN